MPGFPARSVSLSLAGLFDLIKLLQKIQKFVRNRLILHGAIKGAQFGSNIRIGPKSIICAPLSRNTHLVHLRLIFHYPTCAPRVTPFPDVLP